MEKAKFYEYFYLIKLNKISFCLLGVNLLYGYLYTIANTYSINYIY